MPTYEYRCEKCKKEFTLRMNFREYERKKVKCPRCNKGKVERLMATVSVKTSKKS
ncbi:MAG: zinc ribbon domain-containing protein [Planctomycetes bacterium]|nr:zinc ribbon domain-containing protein [Planctomycetota bacterium]